MKVKFIMSIAVASAIGVNAQNVGIGVPAPTEKLDVLGTARLRNLASLDYQVVYADPNGVLTINAPAGRQAWMVYGNAGLTTGVHFLGTTDAVALDFRTNNLIRFRIPDNAARLLAFEDGTALAPTYSWNADPDIGVYRSGIDQLSFSTTGIERIRILNNGRVQVHPAFTMPWPGGNPRLGVRMDATDDWGIASYLNENHGNPDWQATIIGNVGPASNLGASVIAVQSGTHTGGVALMAGYGNLFRLIGERLAGAFTDDDNFEGDGDVALYVNSSFLNSGNGVIYISADGGFANWYVGYWDLFGYNKIVGPGAVSTVIKDTSGNDVIMFAPEAPEVLFMDFGEGKIVNGKAVVNIDPNLSKNIVVNEEHPLRVYIQMEEGGIQCGLYEVRDKSATSFTVITEKPCNATFSYMIVANRADEVIPGKGVARYSEARFPLFKVPHKDRTQTWRSTSSPSEK